MIKYSVIIPIYNVEPYLKKCLDSVVNQTYNNYECILICDNSIDKSNIIADKYVAKYNFKKCFYENIGLSEARNIGVKESVGDYLLFLDGDDYFEDDLLEKLNKIISNQDLIRFQVREIFKDRFIDWNEKECNGTGINCFANIINFHYVENAWAYCYKASFYKQNDFKFMKDCIGEDFGLIPLIIAKASQMTVTSYIGYNYVQREDSLMSNKSYEKRIQKMDDILRQAKFLKKELYEIKNNKLFIKFINNSLIYFSTTLKYNDYKKYNKILKQLKAFDYLPNNGVKQKIKSILIRNNAYIYYNYIARFL